jgi:hypothetical protein
LIYGDVDRDVRDRSEDAAGDGLMFDSCDLAFDWRTRKEFVGRKWSKPEDAAPGTPVAARSEQKPRDFQDSLTEMESSRSL